MKHVTIYTDGSCSLNPGPGGWAAILKCDKHEREITGYAALTTNNQMELIAALEGLRALKHPCRVSLYTDSAYLANSFDKQWIHQWRNNGWLTKRKKPVKNRELWEELWEQVQRHRVAWIKVKAHSNNQYNERADRLAVNAREEQTSNNVLKNY